ncbi:trypsin-like peptidase domain-containing protein [Herbidospora mongoliensis]|uniref:trypsin-like peptidase domain-containing protein n=1 Tax=Herbidospora mongoliensis TaxID=688067 RepID=UPI00082CED22|nr:trypsin-like peptidase domain-containing protein [Herbidospora mongoliensis]
MIEKLLALAVLAAVTACGQEPPPTAQAVAPSPAAAPSHPNVVMLLATAAGCKKRTEGTGFVYAPERVMTVAHAVAGSTAPITVTGSDGRHHEGTVVVFDPDRDVAVLRVPGLTARPLRFAPADDGDDFTFAGYQKGGHFTERPGRVDRVTPAVSNDIYHKHEVEREVLVVLAKVEPGLAGAPMLGSGGMVTGMVYAADTGNPVKGYALSAKELGRPAEQGRTATEPVSTQECD